MRLDHAPCCRLLYALVALLLLPGAGIKRKIALALLTARISERQKDGIMDRVTSVVEAEMTQKAMRVNIPDHRTAAQLDRVHTAVKDLIRDEVLGQNKLCVLK